MKNPQFTIPALITACLTTLPLSSAQAQNTQEAAYMAVQQTYEGQPAPYYLSANTPVIFVSLAGTSPQNLRPVGSPTMPIAADTACDQFAQAFATAKAVALSLASHMAVKLADGTPTASQYAAHYDNCRG